MKLSVLDQSSVRQGVTPTDAVRETAGARHVDAPGYHRDWLAEHRSSPGLASTAPVIFESSRGRQPVGPNSGLLCAGSSG